jgi:hypothetical protein
MGMGGHYPVTWFLFSRTEVKITYIGLGFVYDVIIDPSLLSFPPGCLLLQASPRACSKPTLIFYFEIIKIKIFRGLLIIDYKDVFQPIII